MQALMRSPSLKLVSFNKGFLLSAVTFHRLYRALDWHEGRVGSRKV